MLKQCYVTSLLIFTGLLIVIAYPDPSKDDYCKHKCLTNPTVENTACKCKKHPKCAPVEKNWTIKMIERKRWVDVHNTLRNFQAGGGEMEKWKIPEASNMHILNYDVGLEYTAHCLGMSCNFDHDICRGTQKFNDPGQNILYLSGDIGYDLMYNHTRTIRNYYDEIKDVPLRLLNGWEDPFKLKLNIGHWGQLIWWSHTHIGCYNTMFPQKGKVGASFFLNTCNYASDFHAGPGNLLGRPPFLQGKPCTQCPKKRPCGSKQYPNLCGKEEPIPDLDWELLDPSHGNPGQSGNSGHSMMTMKTMLIVIAGGALVSRIFWR